MSTKNLYPTDGQLCRAVLCGILNHPAVKNAKIYAPNNARVPVPLVKGRTSAGLELLEPGLTLAVFPKFSGYNVKTGAISPRDKDKSIYYEEAALGSTLGNQNNKEYRVMGTFTMVAQLHYRQTEFDVPVKLKAQVVDPDSQLSIYTPFQDSYQYVDDSHPSDLVSLNDPHRTIETSITVFPGEEIIRDWSPLIRGVIRDLQIVKPYVIRQPSIIACDYPTTNWLKKGENLVFHTSSIIFQFQLFEPPTVSLIDFPRVREINIEDSPA